MRKSNNIGRARSMRKRMSAAEVRLWIRIRGDHGGIHFRKQHPYDPYILDFYSIAAKLAVEVDGIHHVMGDRPVRDAKRDAWLESEAIFTYRVVATELMVDPDEVAAGVIALALERMAELGNPPPSRAGGPVCSANATFPGLGGSQSGAGEVRQGAGDLGDN